MSSDQENKCPKVINGIRFDDQKSYNKRLRQDAEALASLIYEIYLDKKAKKLLPTGTTVQVSDHAHTARSEKVKLVGQNGRLL